MFANLVCSQFVCSHYLYEIITANVPVKDITTHHISAIIFDHKLQLHKAVYDRQAVGSKFPSFVNTVSRGRSSVIIVTAPPSRAIISKSMRDLEADYPWLACTASRLEWRPDKGIKPSSRSDTSRDIGGKL